MNNKNPKINLVNRIEKTFKVTNKTDGIALLEKNEIGCVGNVSVSYYVCITLEFTLSQDVTV